MYISETIVMCLVAHVESCDSLVLLRRALRWPFVQNIATWGVWALILRAMFEDQWSAFRWNSIELLLLCYEMYLRLWLHLVVVHLMTLSKCLLLLGGDQLIWHAVWPSCELKRVVSIRLHHGSNEIEPSVLILISQVLLEHLLVLVHLWRVLVWAVGGHLMGRVITHNLILDAGRC